MKTLLAKAQRTPGKYLYIVKTVQMADNVAHNSGYPYNRASQVVQINKSTIRLVSENNLEKILGLEFHDYDISAGVKLTDEQAGIVRSRIRA